MGSGKQFIFHHLLRERVGRIRQRYVQLGPITTQRARWAWRVLRSKYPQLLLDINLEHKFAMGPFPFPRHLDASGEFETLLVEDVAICWPCDLDTIGIGWIYREVFAAPWMNPHAYEYRDVRMVPGSWVIDAGASEGFFVHYALRRGCNVIAVEPHPGFASALRLTFQSEIAQGRVRVVEGVVGSSLQTLRLTRGELDVFSSHIDPDGEVQVHAYTLDRLVDAQGIRNLSFIKTDIEGAELHILEGATNLLHHSRPNLSIAVYHAESTASILKDQLKRIAPHYRVRFRGAWLRNDDNPRPYMLLASAR